MPSEAATKPFEDAATTADVGVIVLLHLLTETRMAMGIDADGTQTLARAVEIVRAYDRTARFVGPAARTILNNVSRAGRRGLRLRFARHRRLIATLASAPEN